MANLSFRSGIKAPMFVWQQAPGLHRLGDDYKLGCYLILQELGDIITTHALKSGFCGLEC